MSISQGFILPLLLTIHLNVYAYEDNHGLNDRVSLTVTGDGEIPGVGVSPPLPSSSSASSYKPTSTFTPVDELPPRPIQDESRLLTYLMKNYNREVRPVVNASTAVVVHVGITLTQIFDMDEKNQVMTTNVWLDQEWNDELLAWNPSDFGNISIIRIPCDKIWLPDIVLYNNADDFSGQYMRSLALVNYTGRVFWPPPTKFRSTCPVDVAFFPFDDQTCMLKLGSWIHDGFSVDVVNRTSIADLTNYLPNGEWTLMQPPRLVRRVKYYPCCPDLPFPEIFITLQIRRKTLYYMYNIVFPCMMMSTLTVLVFCLPPDSGEKIGLGITVLLAFSVFMLAIAEKMPETSESIPLIGIYLTSVMAITCVSVVMTVIVLNFFYRGPTLTEVPPWIQIYVLGKHPKDVRRTENRTYRNNEPPLRRPSCIPVAGNSSIHKTLTALSETCSVSLLKRSVKYNKPNINHGDNNHSGARSPKSINSSNRNGFDLYSDVGVDFPDDLTFSGVNGNAGESLPMVDRSRASSLEIRVKPPSSCGAESVSPDIDSPSPYDARHSDLFSSGLNDQLHDSPDLDLNKILDLMSKKQKEDDAINDTLRDWKLLAQKVDFILFWVFLALTTVTSFVFIFILPFHHRGKLL